MLEAYAHRSLRPDPRRDPTMPTMGTSEDSMIEPRYDAAANLLHVTVTDTLRSEEIAAYFASVPSLPGLRPGFVEIVDLNLATDLEIRLSDMPRLETLSMGMIAAGHESTLVLAFTSMAKAMIPLMMPLFHHVDLNIHVFRDPSDFQAMLESLQAGEDGAPPS